MSSPTRYKILIGAIFLVGLTIIGASIVVGIARRDAQVVDNPYEAGLRFDETRLREEALGWRVEMPNRVAVGRLRLAASLYDREGGALEGADVVFLLSRRGSPRLDYRQAAGTGRGAYAADVTLAESGYWDVRVSVARGSERMDFNRTIYVGG